MPRPPVSRIPYIFWDLVPSASIRHGDHEVAYVSTCRSMAVRGVMAWLSVVV